MRILSAFLLLFLASPLFSQEVVYPTVYVGTVDTEIKDLKWHKWTTKNFVVLAINETQGKFLANNIEKIKAWSLSRWGVPKTEALNFNFSAECRVFCVPDKTLMKKLFGIETSRVEIKRQQDKIELSVIWLVLDDIPLKTIPVPLSEVCFSEFNQRYNNKISYCILRGMCLLNSPVLNIRLELVELSKNKEVYFSQSMFEMTFDQWNKLSEDKKKTFDRECIVLCLLMRKEFGETKLYNFFSAEKIQSPEAALNFVYGFSDYKKFDVSLFRYTKELCSDVVAGKTPDSYLIIKAK
jgi:hypothetical protein